MNDFNVKQAGTDLLRNHESLLWGEYGAYATMKDRAQAGMDMVRDRLIDVQAELEKRRLGTAQGATD